MRIETLCLITLNIETYTEYGVDKSMSRVMMIGQRKFHKIHIADSTRVGLGNNRADHQPLKFEPLHTVSQPWTVHIHVRNGLIAA